MYLSSFVVVCFFAFMLHLKLLLLFVHSNTFIIRALVTVFKKLFFFLVRNDCKCLTDRTDSKLMNTFIKVKVILVAQLLFTLTLQ